VYRYGIGHSIGHVFCFFVMAVFLGWKARTLGQRAIVAAAILFFAAATEMLQVLPTNMRFEWRDFLSDALGMVFGLLLLAVVQRRRLPQVEVSSTAVSAVEPAEPYIG
jgi:hypothetical protein